MKKDIVFRWAVGDNSTQTFRKLYDSARKEYLSMSKMSILSFFRYFPESRFVVTFNGDNFDDFLSEFAAISPSLPSRVEFLNSLTYPNPYHFKPDSGVWWKWIPFRISENDTEICVDTDVICLSDPLSLKDHIEKEFPIVLMSDRIQYFCPRVVGNLYKNEILHNRIPLNCGFVAFAPSISFEKEFVEATKLVNYCSIDPSGYGYGSGNQSMFLDEQGSFNIGLYKSDIPFALLSRGTCVYGNELIHRLLDGQTVEICHFIGQSKQLYREIEMDIFRSIYDENFRIDPDQYKVKSKKINDAFFEDF